MVTCLYFGFHRGQEKTSAIELSSASEALCNETYTYYFMVIFCLTIDLYYVGWKYTDGN